MQIIHYVCAAGGGMTGSVIQAIVNGKSTMSGPLAD